jgi:hypothetical protein
MIERAASPPHLTSSISLDRDSTELADHLSDDAMRLMRVEDRH